MNGSELALPFSVRVTNIQAFADRFIHAPAYIMRGR